MLYLINRKGFIMEENLKEPNIIINGENLIDEFEKECKEIVGKYGDKAKGYEIAYMINGKEPDESKKIFGMPIPVPHEITEDMIADKIARPNGSCLYRLSTFIN